MSKRTGRSVLATALCLSAVSLVPFVWSTSAQADPYCDTQRHTQAYVTQMICVDSYLPSQEGNRYDIAGLVDGYSSTAWCEGEPGHGIGSRIRISFEASAPVLALHILNGYNKSMDHFRRNGRVRELRLTVISYDHNEPVRERLITLRDEPLSQRIAMPWIVEDPRQIELEIVSVYPGTRFQDTCLSGLGTDFGM